MWEVFFPYGLGMSLSVDVIIEAMGGAEAAARLTGVGTEAVRKWRQARAIPAKHWPAVMASTPYSWRDLQAGRDLQTGRDLQAGRDLKPTDKGDSMGVTETAAPAGATAVLVLADGTMFWGRGFGAHTPADGAEASELCFNTGMTGYQETLTDPSYAGQVIAFTFPHIGNVGANREDIEALTIAARGLVVKQDVTEPSNWRSAQTLDAWLRAQNVPGISGVDTRALTMRIRDGGPPHGVCGLSGKRSFRCRGPAGKGGGLAAGSKAWIWRKRFPARRPTPGTKRCGPGLKGSDGRRVRSITSWRWIMAPKRNILRSLASAGCLVTVVPATSTAEDILRHKPDGVFSLERAWRPCGDWGFTPCLPFRACSPAERRFSAFAWDISFWLWRWVRAPTSSTAGIVGPTSR